MFTPDHGLLWRPDALVEATSKATKQQFLQTWGGIHFLLVKVDNFESQLAQGLAMQPNPSAQTHSVVPTGGTSTGEVNPVLVIARIEQARKLRKLARGVPKTALLEPRCIVAIERHGTRAGSSLEISVGRSRRSGIVMLHKSVSTLHAHFRSDKAEGLLLRDAGSRNGTLVNGVVTTEHEVAVERGDEIRFGEVDALVCSAEALWEAVTSF